MMNSILKKGFSLMAAAVSVIAANAQDIKIQHLSPNHTFVRLTGDDKLLLLPIQESVEDAKINVIVDGNAERTFYARLAKNKTDFKVPFDLSPYKGKNVILEVISHHDRSSIREAKDDASWHDIEIADSFDTTNREQYRPLFHHTPEYGWMNDPNGMFYKDGVWHLYYQWNPYGSKWQNMTWGHSTSKDLINWEHHPAAILPNGLGTVFSGSSAIDVDNSAGFGENAVVAMYTSAADSQTQSLAVSHDNGETFEIYPGNPVIALDSEARDPNMFWNPETKQWTLVLAHALDREMLIFTSPDMKEWTLQSSFGKGLGAQEGVWECPDLMELEVEGTGEKKWVLICNLNPGGPFGGSGIQYFTGDFDGKKFIVDTDADGNVPTKWLDFGKDNYALVSWSDAPSGRRPVIGWMSNWQYAADVPTMQFRSANTLPAEMTLFKNSDGQYYASLEPVKEIDSMRGTLIANQKKITISGKGHKVSLPSANKGICEILMTIDPKKAEKVNLILSNSRGEQTLMSYDPAEHIFSFDRTKSGITDFSRDFPAVTTAPTFGADKLTLRIFVDTSSIEVFGNDGRFAMTNLVFPTEPYTQLTISSEKGNADISNLKIYSLNPNK